MKYGYFQENAVNGISRITAPIDFTTKIQLNAFNNKFICYGTCEEILKWLKENGNVVVECDTSKKKFSSKKCKNNVTVDLFADSNQNYDNYKNDINIRDSIMMLEIRPTAPLMDLKYHPVRRFILKPNSKLDEIYSKLLSSLDTNWKNSVLCPKIITLHNHFFRRRTKSGLAKSKLLKLNLKLKSHSIFDDDYGDHVGDDDEDYDDELGVGDEIENDIENDVMEMEDEEVKMEEVEKHFQSFFEWLRKSKISDGIYRKFEKSPVPPPGVLTPYNLELVNDLEINQAEQHIKEVIENAKRAEAESEKGKSEGNEEEIQATTSTATSSITKTTKTTLKSPKCEHSKSDLFSERGTIVKNLFKLF